MRRVVEVASLAAPGDAVEDLETDGETLWTSDEESFRFKKCSAVDFTAPMLAPNRTFQNTLLRLRPGAVFARTYPDSCGNCS